ncbi:cytosolic protein [Candidatus Poribacteria bacterium]|nr:MAG: cytosolic protein [Candidatus Poribacteria bacterium]
MKHITQQEIADYVEANIQSFHQRRLDSLQKLELMKIVRRKNPYLFKAKNINTAQDFVKIILDAHLASQEETIFGEFLEKLAIFICSKVYSGRKSMVTGIDLEFERDNNRYIVSIKSGPNWANADQRKKMLENFRKAKQAFGINTSSMNVVAVNGCCYGKDGKPNKGDYLKLCGQRFWKFISGDDNLYTDIVEPLGHQAKERNEQFTEEYAKVVNRFTAEFIGTFCDTEGNMLWEEIVKFNSAETAS